MSKKCKILFFVIAIFTFLCMNVFAQTCMFVCSTDPLTTGDQVIFDKLKEWGYTPTAVLSSDLASYVEADYEPYDFIFTSESVGSSSLAPLKLIPKPLLNSEGWASKPEALAWADPASSESLAPEPIVILEKAAGHPLAAGYNPGDVLDLCSDPAALTVPIKPTIEVIPIAGMVSDPSKLLIFGIEKGTTLTDGSITGNRAASVNIHEFGYPYLTDAALAFYQAAIRWILQGSGGGETCMFVVVQDPLTTGDQIIHDKLVEWGYHVTPVVSSDLVTFTDADYEAYDFIFASESVGSSSLAPLKLIPKPLVNSEAWASKPEALAWCDPMSMGPNAPEPVVILEEAAGHPLAAGYNPGDVLDLITDPSALTVPIEPTIDVIPIAGAKLDTSWLYIFGIEKGTTLTDGSITGNRAALVGIHEFGYPYISEAGWAFYHAAIKWVTQTDSTNTDIHERNSEYLDDFNLAQNYPNPFNPSTKIVYHIPYKSKVRITVYTIVGRKVAELINEEKLAGRHEVNFEAGDLSSGVYIYQLSYSGQVVSKKMLLLQ